MINNHQNKKDEGSVIPAVIAVTGAVIGAGVVAVAGAIAMKDEKNREKVKEALDTVHDKASDFVDEVKKDSYAMKEGVEKKIAESKDKAKKLES